MIETNWTNCYKELSELPQEETKNLNSPTTSKEISLVVLKHPAKKSPGPGVPDDSFG